MFKKMICIIGAALLIGSLAACSSDSEAKDISKTLGIDLSGGKILSSEDTHDGFHGDGNTYVAISFDENTGTALTGAIANNSDWCALPLSETLQTVVYGTTDGNAKSGPYITDDQGASIIPSMKHGYYYFYDRHSESKNPKDDKELLNRSSLNFTIALYDMDHHKLYYDKMDT